MSDENIKAQKITRSNSASSSTRSGSFETRKLKQILMEDFDNKIKYCKKNYGCGYTIDKIISKSQYIPYIFNEDSDKIDDTCNLIDYIDDMLAETNIEIDIEEKNKINYDLDDDNCIKKREGVRHVHSIESENDKIKENILALEKFIRNIKKIQSKYCDDIDYIIIVREDINALVIYLEINYDLYEYTFIRQNRGKFLDDIVEFCKENSIKNFH